LLFLNNYSALLLVFIGIGGFDDADEAGDGWPRLANILLNLKVEPGPRCVGGFNKDFLPLSGDVVSVAAAVDAAAADFDDADEADCCEGGKGMADCLVLADEGEDDFIPWVKIIEESLPEGGVDGFWYCCCCCCVMDVVLTRGKPIFALTWVIRGPADWRYNFLFAAVVAAVAAVGTIGNVKGRAGTGGIDESLAETADEDRLWEDFLIDPVLLSFGWRVKLCLNEAVLVEDEVEGVKIIPVPLFTLPSCETRDEGIGCYIYR
jgi:hypothetical protein